MEDPNFDRESYEAERAERQAKGFAKTVLAHEMAGLTGAPKTRAERRRLAKAMKKVQMT